MTSRHPGWEEILTFVESGTDARTWIGDHCRTCAECRDVERRVRRLLGTMEMASIVPPREELVETIIRRLAEERALAAAETSKGETTSVAGAVGRLGAKLASGIREFFAPLVADSHTPLAAVRGATTFASPRLMIFETEAFTISVSLSEGDDSGTLDAQGQVMPKQASALPEKGTAVLRCRGRDDAWTMPLSEFGQFSFRGVPEGELQIRVDLGEVVLRLAPIPAHDDL